MATTQEYAEFVCEQIDGEFEIGYKKMFGEYMVYANGKPVLLLCDNTVYVKKVPELALLLTNAATGVPYTNASLHYVLDIDDRELTTSVVEILEKITPIPQKRKRKTAPTGYQNPTEPKKPNLGDDTK